MRRRVRPAHPDRKLAELYVRPHVHTRWPDHRARVAETIAVMAELNLGCGPFATVADLSCGDATISRSLAGTTVTLGDFAPGYPITGPIEATIAQVEDVDLFVCTETVEHLDDPDAVLTEIRGRAWHLVLSTPLAELHPEQNPEHYWAWDADGVRDMLAHAGWEPVIYRELLHPLASYQIWGCR